MLCEAIINIDDEIGLPKHLGKKKLKECGLIMRVQDAYTLICPAGHIRMTSEWDGKSFQDFLNTRGKSKV